MRKLRPEQYSDSKARAGHKLKAETLSHHLDTLTERNETHDFELFCRKLCERTLCPNLKPATGPEGGGDSKADTETIPVADEISKLGYVGLANSGTERWAFAFSAKKTWASKARSDVEGLVKTQRGYTRIFFVTSRNARAKDRARVEDELSRQYGVQVTILDRSWILKEVIENNRRDLAFHYLGIGEETSDTELGPSDYSRKQQLADLERELQDPEAFAGMTIHRATEALVAAKLSRSLGLPRTDVDGKFMRAVRLADDGGTERQQLDARYESLWTAFWWFDDIRTVLREYGAFETLTIDNDHAINLELLCNLTQLLFNAVINDMVTAEEAQLESRVARLSARLQKLADDPERPNNALQARTSLLTVQVNNAALAKDAKRLSALWPKFSEVLAKAEGLGEFKADNLLRMIEICGNMAGKDRGYRDLVDQAAEFIAKRTGESEGALVLLKRAQQLDFDQNMEMIRLLGKAGRQLTKKEHADSLIDALTLLALAYRSAGLLWAARASCTTALATLFIEGEESGDLAPTVFPTLMLAAAIANEMKHFPELLDAVQIARGCLSALPFDEESSNRAADRLQNTDMVLACQIINLPALALEKLSAMPDVLHGLEFFHSCSALLYALGYEDLLRAEGSIAPEESAQDMAKLFNLLASQPAGDALWRPAVFNDGGEQVFSTLVLGVRVNVIHATTDTSITVAEAVIATIEAFFATAVDLDAIGHTERFDIRIQEADISRYELKIDADHMKATVRWPKDGMPGPSSLYGDFLDLLLRTAGSTFAATCMVKDMAGTVERLFKADSALDRGAMIGSVGMSRQRIFKGVARLSAWDRRAPKRYEPRPDRPCIERQRLDSDGEEPAQDKEVAEPAGRPTVNDHRRMVVRSVIDTHLWDRAGWAGAAYAQMDPRLPPVLALMFRDGDAATKIFERWRERFGQVDKGDEISISIVRKFSAQHPMHYGMVVTSKLPDDPQDSHLSTVALRCLTMEPADDVNLTNFLRSYEEAGAYLLMPAILNGGNTPAFQKHLALLKRRLAIKMAAEVKAYDVETVFLRSHCIQPPQE